MRTFFINAFNKITKVGVLLLRSKSRDGGAEGYFIAKNKNLSKNNK